MTTKATLYIDEKLYKAFKIKAAHTDKKLSGLVAEAMHYQLNAGRHRHIAGRSNSFILLCKNANVNSG